MFDQNSEELMMENNGFQLSILILASFDKRFTIVGTRQWNILLVLIKITLSETFDGKHFNWESLVQIKI